MIRQATAVFLTLLAAACAPRESARSGTVKDEPPRGGVAFVQPYWSAGEEVLALADVLQVTLTWSEIEPVEGSYRWDVPKLAGALDAAKANGKKVTIRLATSWSDVARPIPEWLVANGVKLLAPDPEWVAAAPGRENLFEPEWWNPVYQTAYAKLVRAYGARFDQDDLVAFIDMRHYGFWGEGHRWGHAVPWPEGVAKAELLKTFVDLHFAAFPTTPLAVNVGPDQDEPYPAGTAIDHALGKGAWMRRDGFGSYVGAADSALMKAEDGQAPLVAEPGRALAEYLDGQVQGYSVDALFQDMLAHGADYIVMGWSADDWRRLESERPDLVATLSGK